MNTHPDIPEQLKELRLHYLAENYFDFITKAEEENLSAEQTIQKMMILELAERCQRSIEARIKSAKIGRFKPMDNFDWSWPESLDRAKIDESMSLRFIEAKENIILMGAQGLGKTMIARNIAWKAVNAGISTVFTPASKLVTDLASAGPFLERRLARYTKPALLIIDEIGYLEFENKAADLLFEVISRRYENGSIVLTTNLAFKDWNKIFPGAACVTAMLDRLIHHCEILQVQGPSFRQHESKQRKLLSGESLKNSQSKGKAP